MAFDEALADRIREVLAPRSEVTASTGIWSHCGGIPSHFDTNGDCVQDFFGSGENALTHGLNAAETDLQHWQTAAAASGQKLADWVSRAV